MSSSVQNGKIYHKGYDGKTLPPIRVKEAKKEDLSKSRLILIPIHSSVVPPSLSDKKENAGSRDIYDMPNCYEDVLKNICDKCDLLSHILWRNVQLVESRFESRFRPCKKDNSACFLQFHTMQAPVLADLNVTLAMVDHLGISNDSDSSSRESIDRHVAMVDHVGISNDSNSSSRESIDRYEKIVAFIYILAGQEPADKKTEDSIEEIFERVIPYYIEESREKPGVTPMLFIAALLKWYGFEVRDAIAKGFGTLTDIDSILIEQDKELPHGNLRKQAEDCRRVNKQLTLLNQSLTGLRSRVNYVAESARSLKSHVSTMKKYVKVEIKEAQYNTIGQCSRGNIKRIVNKLENSKFMMRDTDKFDMIERAMQQYQTDIKSLKAHLAINIGLVSNLYAQLVTEEAARDGANMLIISIFGAILLPMTFTCIFLASPIFDFTTTFRGTTIKPLPLVLFVGISIILSGCGRLVKKFHSRRKKAREQEGIRQDEKKQGKEDPVKTHADSPERNWWRKLKTRTLLIESGQNGLSVPRAQFAPRGSQVPLVNGDPAVN